MSVHTSAPEPSYLEHKGKYKGIFAWILSTDHKRIALLYLFSIMTFFCTGAILGLLMKFELIAPGKTIMEAQTLYIAWHRDDLCRCYSRFACSFW
jgi:hypothetical protein